MCFPFFLVHAAYARCSAFRILWADAFLFFPSCADSCFRLQTGSRTRPCRNDFLRLRPPHQNEALRTMTMHFFLSPGSWITRLSIFFATPLSLLSRSRLFIHHSLSLTILPHPKQKALAFLIIRDPHVHTTHISFLVPSHSWIALCSVPSIDIIHSPFSHSIIPHTHP